MKYQWDIEKKKTISNPYFKKQKRQKIAERKGEKLQLLAEKLTTDKTSEERILYEALIENRIDFEFQKVLSHYKHQYIADFVINLKSGRKLVVECDGFYHFTNKGREKDRLRDARIYSIFGHKTLRFNNSQVSNDIKGVLFKILCYEPKRMFAHTQE